ncbi:MAG: hypothetical protein ACXVYY_00975 [Oryzihumus sp.]
MRVPLFPKDVPPPTYPAQRIVIEPPLDYWDETEAQLRESEERDKEIARQMNAEAREDSA